MKTNRRDFLKAVGGIGLFSIVPSSVLGGRGRVAPSDQLTKGIIGVGGIGRSSYHFTSDKYCRLVAMCDVDSKHLEQAKAEAKEKFNEDCATYHDFRDLIKDPNVDVVHIATPPHWHALMSIEAAKAGKDIWCEKPMTRTIGEGRAVKEAVKRYNRIFRLNTWFRFKDTFYGLGTTVEPLKKLVKSGLLGWPLKFTVSGTTGFTWKFFWVGKENLVPQTVPSNLDYDMWLGKGVAASDEVETCKVKEMMDCKIAEPTVIFIINENTREASRYGIKNEFFSKGSVNYVGHEIRAVIMNMLSCDVGDTICIVSGESIAIEAAIEASEGTIIAVEPDARDMRALQDNVSKFGVHNIEIISGVTKENMANVPTPRLAFIVASKRLEDEIRTLLEVNPKMQFIVYTLELNMLVNIKNIFAKYHIEDTEVLQISVSKTDKRSVMVAQPSPWMISGTPAD